MPAAANATNWIRVGILALPLYGLLTFWGTFTHEPNRNRLCGNHKRCPSGLERYHIAGLI